MKSQALGTRGHRLVANCEALIAEQEEWISEHGGDKDGYVKHYGSSTREGHYGNGGEAIFEADTAHLAALKVRLGQIRGLR